MCEGARLQSCRKWHKTKVDFSHCYASRLNSPVKPERALRSTKAALSEPVSSSASEPEQASGKA